MAKLHIGTARLHALAVSPWTDWGMLATPAQAMSPGPVDLGWENVATGSLFFPGASSHLALSEEAISHSIVGSYISSDASNGAFGKISKYETAVSRKGFTKPPFSRVHALPPKRSALETTASTIYDNVPDTHKVATAALAKAMPLLPIALKVAPTAGLINTTIKVQKTDLLPQYVEEFGYRVGTDVTIAGSMIGSALTAFYEQATTKLNIGSSFAPGDTQVRTSPQAYSVRPADQQGWVSHATQTFELTPPQHLTHNGYADIHLVVDSVTLAVSAIVDLSDVQGVWPDAVRDMKRVNASVATQIKNANLGVLTAAPLTERPVSTTNQYLTGEQRRHTDDWWDQIKLITADLTKAVAGMDPAAALAAYNLEKGTSLTLEELQALQTIKDTDGGGIKWGDLAAKAGSWLGTAGSGAFELLKEWGPTGILAGWAGYEGIKSVKKSKIPSWLIFGGLGLAAVAIMK